MSALSSSCLPLLEVFYFFFLQMASIYFHCKLFRVSIDTSIFCTKSYKKFITLCAKIEILKWIGYKFSKDKLINYFIREKVGVISIEDKMIKNKQMISICSMEGRIRIR